MRSLIRYQGDVYLVTAGHVVCGYDPKQGTFGQPVFISVKRTKFGSTKTFTLSRDSPRAPSWFTGEFVTIRYKKQLADIAGVYIPPELYAHVGVVEKLIPVLSTDLFTFVKYHQPESYSCGTITCRRPRGRSPRV